MRPREPSARSCIPYITPSEMKYRLEDLKRTLHQNNLNLDRIKEQTGMLEEEALWHSVDLEMPLSRKEAIELANNKELQSARTRQYTTSLNNIDYAWKLILEMNQQRLPYDQHSIIRLQRNIEPDASENGELYRAGEAHINGHTIHGNPYEEMPQFLSIMNGALTANDAIYKLSGTEPNYEALFNYIYLGEGQAENKRWDHLREYAAHPLDLAAYAHMEIARIHPFNDGNGRLARLVMNGILRRYNFPVVIVPMREREHYISQVQIGDQAYRAKLKRSIAYKPFGTYIGSKVERTLEALITGETHEFAE